MPAGVFLLTCFPSLTNKGFCHFSLVNHPTPVPIIYFFQGVPWEAGVLEHLSLPLFLSVQQPQVLWVEAAVDIRVPLSHS